MECSAKEDRNIKDVFRSYLSLSKIVPVAEAGASASGGSSSGGLKRRSSAYVSNKGNRRSVSPAVASTSGEEAAGSSSSSSTLEPTGFSRFKPRSRSLIRRSSRKAKQQMRDANDDCHVS